VILVLATTDDELYGARRRLSQLGAASSEVLAPGGVRRLLLATIADEPDPICLVANLRSEGWIAVLRPAGGPGLEAWMRHTNPITFGERLTVCFAWSEHNRRGLPNVVELDPGGGFGSGAHPSTRLLLEALVERIAGGERVLDVGCGSGVLGISAVRLGAAHALGTDVDPDAVGATLRNAAMNGVQPRVDATLSPLGQVAGTFDVVLANIGREALVGLRHELPTRLAPDGWLAVSGFSSGQADLVAGWLRPLQVVDQRTCGEWSALVLTKP
jgi:ribosomal protein L11 methyltransferase